MKLNEAVIRKVLATVDAGLTDGLGVPIPGKMCVEAAVSYALGLPHGDKPACVDSMVRDIKICLNDAPYWVSKQSRAKGLRRLAIAQLGTAGKLDQQAFVLKVAQLATRQSVPIALRAAAQINPAHSDALEAAAKYCEEEGTQESARFAMTAANAASAAECGFTAMISARAAASAARAARAAEYAARAAVHAAFAVFDAAPDDAAAEKPLTLFAEGVVQILIKLGAQGTQWLYLCEKTA